MSDPFHDRIADWLYGSDEHNDHRALLDDIDNNIASTHSTERCKWHGEWLAEWHDLNAQCPTCTAADDRAARADADFEIRNYRPGNARPY